MNDAATLNVRRLLAEGQRREQYAHLDLAHRDRLFRHAYRVARFFPRRSS